MGSLAKGISLVRHRFFSANPFFLVFHITARCNARCAFCFNWEHVQQARERPELTLEEIARLTARLGPLYQLTLSGGEPFLRRDLPDIIRLFATDCGLQTLTIPTNGMLPARIGASLERALADNPGVHIRLGLSTPEIGPELEAVYQVRNAFAKHQESAALLTALACKYSNLTLTAATLCTAANAGRIRDILAHVRRQMPGFISQLALVRGSLTDDSLKQLDPALARELFRIHRAIFPEDDNRPLAGLLNVLGDSVNEYSLACLERTAPWIPCRCGDRLVVLYDNGDVFPCEYLDRPLGNVRAADFDLKAVLASPQARATVDWIIREHCQCTWECASFVNFFYSPLNMARVLIRYASRPAPPRAVGVVDGDGTS
ncbi:MAG: radical SAM protein [Magnetococcales bacterium]|nr:radical SAM protein [Magnetococcales bacterium]